MLKTKMLIMALIMFMSMTLPAQSSESIYFGDVKLTIGEPEQQVKQKLQNSYDVFPLGDQSGLTKVFGVSSQLDRRDVLGSILFENSKIKSINKNLGDYENIVPMSKLFDTLYAYSKNGARGLVVFTNLRSYEGVITQEIIFSLSDSRQVKIDIIRAPEIVDQVFISEEIF